MKSQPIYGVPNLGSDVAVALGCICPVLDNNHGKGARYKGELVFWYHEDCPVHRNGKKYAIRRPENGR